MSGSHWQMVNSYLIIRVDFNTMKVKGIICGQMNMKDFDMNKPASEVEEAAFSSGSVEDGEAIINEDEASTSRSKKLQLSKEQSKLLEESFRQSPIPGHKEKEELASKLNLRQRQVKVWFQNRRARTKLKQMENECQYLKRCSTSLKEENRKLQLELQKLCALCMSHNHMTTFAPPLAMCARCQCFIAHGARES